MEKDEILKQLELIDLLLKDIPKKYSFLDQEKLKRALNIATQIIGE